MKKLTYIVIGAGGRGQHYMEEAQLHGGYELVGVADPHDWRRNHAKELYNLPEDRCFTHYDDLLALGKIADFAVIATQDKMHIEPALKAIELGYDLLLEKPVAPTPEECLKIADAAEAKGVKVLVCHVLRYGPFWRKVKEIIDSGKLGKIMSISHVEAVGNIHQSHSFIRGPWRNSVESSPMLLQKSCHDLDLLQWLLGAECKKVQSFGSLSYFNKANCPEGAPHRCIDGCPVGDTCPYNAVKVYLERPYKDVAWVTKHAIQHEGYTDEEVKQMLRETDYGVCVFQSKNDVVDHQTVNLEYEDGQTACMTMAAFNYGGRRIHIMGTKGELISTDSRKIDLLEFSDEDPASETYGYRKHQILDTSEVAGDQTIAGGHGGGDAGIIKDLYLLLAEGKSTPSITSIRTSVNNHLTVFAAEKSRATDTVVYMDDYVETLRK